MILKDTIKEVIISQRETIEKQEITIPREYEIKIDDSFALLITGIRRSGKSTLLKQLLQKQKKGYYLNLEDPRLDGFDLADFSKIELIMHELYGKGGVYFFDEIQNIAKWEKFVRYLVDNKEKVIITGSNASILSQELASKLTGRHLKIELFPFSYSEYLVLKKQNASLTTFEKYLTQGGFPEYIKKENPEILNELLSDIIMKDIAIRFGIKNTGTLNKIAIYLISHVGKEFSYNNIKKMFEVKSVQSVINYISYFENAYLLFTVPQFSYSYKQQQAKPKKVYTIDTGFSTVNTTSFSKDKGKMLENAVFLELKRKRKEIFYYKDKYECDFLIKQNEKITQAIQVCFEITEENKQREITGLMDALKKFHLTEGLILTQEQDDVLIIEKRKIVIKPVWKWLIEKA